MSRKQQLELLKSIEQNTRFTADDVSRIKDLAEDIHIMMEENQKEAIRRDQ